MAQFNEYLCPHCGFSIRTENRFYYRLMSGYYMTVLCSKCKTIHRVSPPMMECREPEDYLHMLRMLDIKSRESRCPECGARGRLRLWAPSDGCPKCHRKLTEHLIGLMVD